MIALYCLPCLLINKLSCTQQRQEEYCCWDTPLSHPPWGSPVTEIIPMSNFGRAMLVFVFFTYLDKIHKQARWSDGLNLSTGLIPFHCGSYNIGALDSLITFILQ